MFKKISGPVALLLLLVPSARADMEFVLDRGGKQLRGAEVCIYPATDMRGDEGFRSNALRSNALQCLTADMMIEVPMGRSMFFLTHPDGYISPVSLMNVSDPRREGYKEVRLPARPAALIDLKSISEMLDPEEGVYFGALAYSDTTHLVPQAPDRESMWVPADVPVIPLIINRGVPTRAGVARTFKHNEKVAAATLFAPDSKAAIVLETSLPAVFRAEGTPFSMEAIVAAAPPKVTLKIGSATYSPLVLPTTMPGWYPALLVFADLPAGRGTVSLHGPMWETQTVDVVIEGNVTNVQQPLQPTPAGTIKVRWPVDGCTAGDRVVKVELRGCPTCPPQTSHVVTDGCLGEDHFDGIPYGSYTVSVSRQGSEERHLVAVLPGRQVDVAAFASRKTAPPSPSK